MTGRNKVTLSRTYVLQSIVLIAGSTKHARINPHTWTEYRDKKIDPVDAAVVTDNAAKLARDLVLEVGPLLIPM
ncbi:hypothetical protein N7460_006969 [Penicillium canescens]|uniref:Uncharacterized protein n=1 Tax=Penicillium canescens TaxID=5083 RepID=A0AAD6N9E1_PENCN|nr:hypothetical protein N7460_006969 [Penicillium canescens]KAJ6064732.1 hypothetical protein N7444_000385 [Penicillium canescens]